MQFLRRLIGYKPEQKTTSIPKPSEALVPSAPEVTALGADVAPPEPVTQSDLADSDPTPVTTPETAKLPPLNLYGATQKLPPLETFVGKPGKHLLYGLNSDVGMVRTNNQDALLVMFNSSVSADSVPDFGLFVVADGMGGQQDGERASAIAARVVAKYITNQFYMKILERAANDETPIIAEVLAEAFQQANDAVTEEIPEGGTTCTAAAIVGDQAYIAHVGDSRAYLLSYEGIEQVTRDHSLVQRLIELEQLSPEEAATHTQKNVLYRALGQNESLEIDTATRRLSPGARLLLCSDGLWNLVPEDRILQTVMASPTPQEACDRLVTIANERGGPDNITVLIIQAPG